MKLSNIDKVLRVDISLDELGKKKGHFYLSYIDIKIKGVLWYVKRI